jgi:hypothetical protein
MRFKTSFIRLLFLQPTSPRGIFTHFWSLKWPWPKSNPKQNFVGIRDSTALAPHEVHRCLTHFIILVTGGLRETNVHKPAKAIALPYRNVCSPLFIISWNYVTEATFASKYANTVFPNYEAASMLLPTTRPTFAQLLRPPLPLRHTTQTSKTFEQTFVCTYASHTQQQQR